MKKLLIVLLVLILILGGLFFARGGHHVLAMAQALYEWAEAESADQSLTIQLSAPGFQADEQIEPVVRQFSVTADTFWSEDDDERIFGLSAGGCSLWLIDEVLYMDTGIAYTVEDDFISQQQLQKFAVGLLLHGRVTKTDQGYRAEMERDGQSFSVSVALESGALRSITVNLDLIQKQQPVHLLAVLTAKPPQAHPLPQNVLDAMVRSEMVPPMSLSEPLEVLLPAMEQLLPLQADVTMGVDCGILSLSETVGLTVDDIGAALVRKGETIPLSLQDLPEQPDPLIVGLALLRSGEFHGGSDFAEFRITMDADTVETVARQLLPQITDLGVSFTESEACVTIRSGKLTDISITAQGEIPFLVTTIPLTFSAKIDIQ